MTRTGFRLALLAVVALAFGSRAHTAPQTDRAVAIVNETPHTMVRFFATNSGAQSWGENRLEETPIPPGQLRMIDFNDGSYRCLFDFKAQFDSGDVKIVQQVNVCAISSYRYSDTAGR